MYPLHYHAIQTDSLGEKRRRRRRRREGEIEREREGGRWRERETEREAEVRDGGERENVHLRLSNVFLHLPSALAQIDCRV
jgi:hypothetical protein